MTTYAIIDSNSGYVWGVTTASNPVEACAKIDAADRGPGAAATTEYTEHGARYRLNGASGYYVYRIDDVTDDDHGLDFLDGQDPQFIANIEAYPLEAVVETHR